MRLATFRAPGKHAAVGAVVSTGIVSLTEAAGRYRPTEVETFSSMLALIRAGETGLDSARQFAERAQADGDLTYSIDTVELEAPVPVPEQIRDCLVFEKHYRQARAMAARIRERVGLSPSASLSAEIPPVWYRQPLYYKSNRHSVVGHGADVIWPDYTEMLDYELEIGIFVGRKGKNIQPKNARRHIFGFSIFNDFSARDAQYAETEGRLGPAKGKDFDTGNVIGPWIVTRDEIPNPYALMMEARVNGETWSRGSTAEMHHSFEDILAHISRSETLFPGEFIGSGTVGGGCGLELDRWIRPGDIVELEIERIGILRNRIVGPLSLSADCCKTNGAK